MSSSSSVISLGAWGGPGGYRWSCRATSGITEITIMGGDHIQFISWTDASGVFSGTFGTNLYADARSVESKVNINWPSEYLMSIRGTYGDSRGLQVVISLSFITNLRTYGPFGSNRSGDQAFSIPISDSVVVGFYGRCGSFLDAIGIHVQPINPRGSVTIGPWGGSGGGSFTFQVDTGYIKRITVCHGDGKIKSISFKDSNGRDYGPFGGQNPYEDTVVQKEIEIGDSQRLTSISGTFGNLVTSLSFQINNIMNGPYGTQTGTSFSIPMQGSEVVGFFGKSGYYLDSIGLYVK